MKNSVFTTFFAKALLVVPALMLGSCIAETMEDCPPRLFITTKYELRSKEGQTRETSTRTPITDWYEEINKVRVYIFDEDYKFVMLWEGGPYTLGETYEVPLNTFNLKEGAYNFVAWTNSGDEYSSNLAELAREEATIDNLMARLTVPADRTFREDLIHRHFGMYPEPIHYSSKSNEESHTIEIAPITHRVNFSAIGLQGEGEYEMIVTDRNTRHSIHNEYIPGGEEYRQVRPMEPISSGDDTRAVASGIAASMLLLQIQDDSGTTFDLHNITSDELVELPDLPEVNGLPDYPSNDLVGFITTIAALKGDTPDFENTREFDIELDFTSEFTIKITVNQWVYVLNNTVL